MIKNNNILKAKTPFFLVSIYDSLKLAIRILTKRRRVSQKHNFKEPFFIIGSGRSGNTLLRSLLVVGGEVAIPPESYVWPRVYRKFRNLSFLPWETLSSMVISEFEAYKEFYTWEINLCKAHLQARNLPNHSRTLSNIINTIYRAYIDQKELKASRWGDKTPINTIFIDKIVKIFPKAQYIHIVRDPRDVVCSYVKAGLYDNYSDALRFWKLSEEKATWLKNKLPSTQFIEIRYEDLVTNTKIELKRLCDFLHIQYNDDMLNFWKDKNALGDVKYNKHHDNIGNPINTKSIGKWKNTLNDHESRHILKETSSLLRKYNYS